MNIHKHETSSKFVRILQYRSTIGYGDKLLDFCDYKTETGIGSVNCINHCEYCADFDYEKHTVYCSYIESEIKKQQNLVQALSDHLVIEIKKLSDILEKAKIKEIFS